MTTNRDEQPTPTVKPVSPYVQGIIDRARKRAKERSPSRAAMQQITGLVRAISPLNPENQVSFSGPQPSGIRSGLEAFGAFVPTGPAASIGIGTAARLGAPRIFAWEVGEAALRGGRAGLDVFGAAPPTPVQVARMRLRTPLGSTGVGAIAPTPSDPLGLRVLQPGLARLEELKNRLMPLRFLTRKVPDEPISAPALRERVRLQPISESAANTFATKSDAAVARTFVRDKQGRVPMLAGVDPSIPGAPTIQDVAARLPAFAPHLTSEQLQAMRTIEADANLYAQTLKRVGVELGKRADIMDGGFYLPRGGADIAGSRESLKIYAPGVGRGKKSFEREAVFKSQAEGLDAGYEYDDFLDAMSVYGKAAGRDIIEEHVANYLKATAGTGIQPGAAIPRGEATIGLPNLQGYSFPDEVANAVNDVIKREAKMPGVEEIDTINGFMLGIKATGDFSFAGIQALLGWYNAPIATSKALGLSFKGWANGRALGSFLVDHDARALMQGTVSTADMARAGLRIGGAETEFAARGLGKVPTIRRFNRAFGFMGDALRVHWMDDLVQEQVAHGKSISQMQASGELDQIAGIANRMTGWTPNKTGGWVGDLLLFAPRFLQSRLETVANAAGGIIQFGPSLVGRGPGASLQQRIAMRSLARMVGAGTLLTVALNEMQGRDTDFRLMVNGRRNTNFMRVRFAGRDWSLFGTWDSLLGAVISVGAGKPQEAYRNLSSPLISKAWDVFTGSTAIGERTRDNAEQIVGTIVNTFLPINASDYPALFQQATEGDVGPAALGIGGNVIGAKSSAVTATERLQDYIALKEGKPFDEVSETRVRFYKNQDPEGRALQQEANRRYEDRPEDLAYNQRKAELAIKGAILGGAPPHAMRKNMDDLGKPNLVQDAEVREVYRGYLAFKDKLASIGFWEQKENLSLYKDNPESKRLYDSFKDMERKEAKRDEMGLSALELREVLLIDSMVKKRQDALINADLTGAIDVGLVRYYGRVGKTIDGKVEEKRLARTLREAQAKIREGQE